MSASRWKSPPTPRLLTGEEPLLGAGTVRDFWSWALSDLRMNTVRSLLAEYLVARALGVADRPRLEWDAADIRLAEGSVEVKAAAYVQAWAQQRPSKIVFSGLKARTWSPEAGYTTEADYNSDAYVFALLSGTDPDAYDALNTDYWQFWVLPRSVIANTGQASIALTRIQLLAGPAVTYSDVATAVHAVLDPRRPRETNDVVTPGALSAVPPSMIEHPDPPPSGHASPTVDRQR